MDDGFMLHRDENVRRKILELCDALCMWERNTGRESTLLILEKPDFKFWAESGKPIPSRLIVSAAKAKLR